MQAMNFRITRRGAGWSWRTEGDGGEEIGTGSAATRAEAAAMVIRSIVCTAAPDAPVNIDDALRRRMAA